jgi:ubiquitin carboxyl-terminal hydrolase 6/32
MEWWVSHLINEPSVITCFFSGQFKSVLTCSACGKKSTRFEPYSSLQLPIANRGRKAANALDVTAVVHFSDSPRFRLPRRFVIPAMNDWTVQDLLHKIAHDHITMSEQKTQPILVAVAIHGSLIQDIYDEDMLLIAVPMPIHVLELDSSVVSSIPMVVDPYGSVLRSDPAPGSDVFVKMSSDRLVKGVITTTHARSSSTPGSYDVLLTEGMANGRTVRHISDVVVKSSAMDRAVYLRFVHRHSVLAPFYCTTPERLVVSGEPFIVRGAACSLTGSALYNIVSRRFFGQSATGSPRRSSKAGTAPVRRFVLRRVCDDGASCGRCHWMHNCSGCLIDEHGAEVLPLEMDETVAIDWVDDTADASAVYESVAVEDDESFRSFRAQHSQSISDSLAMLCSEETLEARCSACQQKQHQQLAPYTPHTKQLSVWSVPPVLVLQLKRFELAVGDQGEYSWHKLRERVDFPVRGLQLSRFLSDVDGAHGEDAECSWRCTETLDARVQRGLAFLQDELGLPLDSASRRCTTYDLYAVIQHAGELDSGHYTAAVRPDSATSDAWWLADDASVSRADRAQLSPSATAYVLFYVRRDVASASRGLEGEHCRRLSDYFPRRPAASTSGPALTQPPLLPKKRPHEHRRHRREEHDAMQAGADAGGRSGRGRAAADGDTSMCAVM